MKSIIRVEKLEFKNLVLHNLIVEIGELPQATKTPQTLQATKTRRTLKDAFKNTGVPLIEIARRLDVSEQTVRNWCSEEFRPQARSVRNIAIFLGVSVAEVREMLTPPGERLGKLEYRLTPIGKNRFVAKDGETSVTFTVRRHKHRTYLNEIESGCDTLLAKKIEMDGSVSGFGRVCQAARLNNSEKKKKS